MQPTDQPDPSQDTGASGEPVPAFAVVIPCYNEEGAIAQTVANLEAALGDAEHHEIVLVNDGSEDQTGAILNTLAHSAPNIVVVHSPVNRGYGAALKLGIRRSRAPLIAIIDADGTYPIPRLPELIRACSDADMVVGARVGDNVEYSKVRAVPKLFLSAWASWIARQRIPDINSGMRVMRRATLMRYFAVLPNSFSFTLTITLAMLTNFDTVKFIPISYKKRIGTSKIRPIRDTIRFMSLIMRTGAYFAPMRAIFPFAVLIMAMSVVSLIYDLINLNLNDTTVLLALFGFNTAMFALLADMIDKRMRS